MASEVFLLFNCQRSVYGKGVIFYNFLLTFRSIYYRLRRVLWENDDGKDEIIIVLTTDYGTGAIELYHMPYGYSNSPLTEVLYY
jgi:hypothetical protein